MSMKNKVILITGSSSGIGRATALLFSSLGAKVVITGRRKNVIHAVAQQCRKNSPFNYEPLEVVADVTVDEDLKRLVNTTVHHFKRIDVLVNNAGIGAFTPIDDPNLMDSYRCITDVNVRAPLYLIHLTEKYLQESKGSIINIASSSGHRPVKNMTIKSLSKSAVDMLTKSMSIELGPKGIRVNSISPGMVDTQWFSNNTGLSDEDVNEIKKAYAGVNPLGRIGKPADIANLVLFLASENASYINGVDYFIDGGAVYENWPSLQ